MSAKVAKASLTQVAASASNVTASATFAKAELEKLVQGAAAGSFLALSATLYKTGVAELSDITLKTMKFETEIEGKAKPHMVYYDETNAGQLDRIAAEITKEAMNMRGEILVPWPVQVAHGLKLTLGGVTNGVASTFDCDIYLALKNPLPGHQSIPAFAAMDGNGNAVSRGLNAAGSVISESTGFSGQGSPAVFMPQFAGGFPHD